MNNKRQFFASPVVYEISAYKVLKCVMKSGQGKKRTPVGNSKWRKKGKRVCTSGWTIPLGVVSVGQCLSILVKYTVFRFSIRSTFNAD